MPCSSNHSVILHAIAGLTPAAGTSVFCSELCNHIARQGREVAIALPRAPASDHYPVDPAVPIATFTPGIAPPSLVHIHALWTPFVHRVAAWALARGIPIVASPHGMLAPWALQNNAWKKRLAFALYQRKDLARASLIHATSSTEVEDIRRLGFAQPIVVAPLGAYLPPERPNKLPASSATETARIVLFLSRIHRVKGLPILLEAWARLKAELPCLAHPTSGRGWRIVIAGPDENGHRQELLANGRSLGLNVVESSWTQACSTGINADVVFTGPVFAEAKAALFAQADIFALPSYSENFGVVIAEALACGVPVITTTTTPWQELEDVGRENSIAEERRAGWWIAPSVDALTRALREAVLLSDDDRRALGSNGRRLVERRYSWQSVAQTMSRAYDWILGCASMPPEVHL